MESLRSLTRTVGVALTAALAASGLGCASTREMTEAMHSVSRRVLDDRPVPASQIQCLWERRLALLPDPTRDGRQAPGLPGQLFLHTSTGMPAEVDGDLAVVVYDDTPRPAGTTPHDPEIWHFDRNTLARLGTTDERFGRCYALFLPWPQTWRDVTQVRIQARYESKPNPALFTAEQKITIDFSDPGSNVFNIDSRTMMSPATVNLFDVRSVPDPQKLLEEAARKQAAQQAAPKPPLSNSPAALTGRSAPGGGGVLPPPGPGNAPAGPSAPAGLLTPSVQLPAPSTLAPAQTGDASTIVMPSQR